MSGEMNGSSADRVTPAPPSRDLSRARRLSAAWTALLIPLVFLPYRWLWLPCALAATLLIAPSQYSPRQVVRRHGTLIFGSVAVLVLQTALDPAWWVPWLAVILVLFWLRERPWWRGWIALLAVPLVWIASACILARPVLWPFGAQGTEKTHPDAVLVCAGDSLTSGVDLDSDKGTYVGVLRRRLSCTVINAGVANDKTADLLARVDKDVVQRHPTIVLLCIGGNDFLDGTPRSKFAAQFDNLVSRIADAGPKIVIVEVPTGIVWNPYAGIYRKTAARYGATLVPESTLRWWFTVELLARDHLAEPLTLDGIHLSPSGAVRVADWLEPYIR